MEVYLLKQNNIGFLLLGSLALQLFKPFFCTQKRTHLLNPLLVIGVYTEKDSSHRNLQVIDVFKRTYK